MSAEGCKRFHHSQHFILLMPCFTFDATGVEEIQRQSGSTTPGPPNLGGLLSALLGGEASAPAPGGNPQRSMHGPSSAGGGGAGGGLMDFLQSPAMQQMANQLLGPPPGSPRVTMRLTLWNAQECMVVDKVVDMYVGVSCTF